MCLINTESLIIFIQEPDLLSSVAGVDRKQSSFFLIFKSPEEPG